LSSRPGVCLEFWRGRCHQVCIFTMKSEWWIVGKTLWISYFTQPGFLQCKHFLGNTTHDFVFSASGSDVTPTSLAGLPMRRLLPAHTPQCCPLASCSGKSNKHFCWEGRIIQSPLVIKKKYNMIVGQICPMSRALPSPTGNPQGAISCNMNCISQPLRLSTVLAGCPLPASWRCTCRSLAPVLGHHVSVPPDELSSFAQDICTTADRIGSLATEDNMTL